MQLRLKGLVALSIAALAVQTAAADQWDFNSYGRNSGFSWSSVHSTTPVLLGQTEEEGMGSPSVGPYGLTFSSDFANDPMDFVVDSSDPQKTTDERWVMSTVPKAPLNAGQALHVDGSDPIGAAPFEFIRVVERGTYVSNDPENDFSRNQTVFITVFDPFAFIPSTPLDITFYPDGTWYAYAEIDLLAASFGAGVRTMQVDLTNILALTPSAPATASITKTSSTIIVPEPATIGFVIMAAAFAVRRKRIHR